MNLFRSLTATQRGIVIAVLSAIVFGLWPASVRGVYQEGGNAAFALVITTWVRALAMVGFCFVTRKRLFTSGANNRAAMVGGISQAVCLVSLFLALKLISGSVVIIILFSHTLMLLLFMVLRGDIKLDTATFVCTVSALAGLVLVLDVFHAHESASFIGYGLALLAAIATVSRVYVYGKQTVERHPIVVGAENFTIAACFVTLIMFYEQPEFPHSFPGLVFAGLGSLSLTLGTFGMFYGVSLLGAFRWSLFVKLEPIFTALFSAWLIGETLKASQYLGIVVVIASLVAYQIVDSRRKARLEAQRQMMAR